MTTRFSRRRRTGYVALEHLQSFLSFPLPNSRILSPQCVSRAIVFREDGIKHIYFVAETKGSEDTTQLRGVEQAKIECAKRHFEVISQGGNIVYGVVKDYQTLCDKVMK